VSNSLAQLAHAVSDIKVEYTLSRFSHRNTLRSSYCGYEYMKFGQFRRPGRNRIKIEPMMLMTV